MDKLYYFVSAKGIKHTFIFNWFVIRHPSLIFTCPSI